MIEDIDFYLTKSGTPNNWRIQSLEIPKEYQWCKSPSEYLYSIKNNISTPPFCKCGNSLGFISFTKGYHKYCSRSCTHKFSQEKRIETCLKKYGVPYFNNRKKAEETCLNKYGVLNPAQISDFDYKSKETKRLKYGDENFNNREKARETSFKKYGVEVPSQSGEVKNKIRVSSKNDDPEVIAKKQETCLSNYGVSCGFSKRDSDYISKRGQATARGLRRFFSHNQPFRFLYIINSKHLKAFKIGITTNLEKRLYTIRKQVMDVEYHYIEYFPFAWELEQYILDKYDNLVECQDKSISGYTEWFSDDYLDKIINEIKTCSLSLV